MGSFVECPKCLGGKRVPDSTGLYSRKCFRCDGTGTVKSDDATSSGEELKSEGVVYASSSLGN